MAIKAANNLRDNGFLKEEVDAYRILNETGECEYINFRFPILLNEFKTKMWVLCQSSTHTLTMPKDQVF